MVAILPNLEAISTWPEFEHRLSGDDEGRNPSKFGSHFNLIADQDRIATNLELSQSFEIWKPVQHELDALQIVAKCLSQSFQIWKPVQPSGFDDISSNASVAILPNLEASSTIGLMTQGYLLSFSSQSFQIWKPVQHISWTVWFFSNDASQSFQIWKPFQQSYLQTVTDSKKVLVAILPNLEAISTWDWNWVSTRQKIVAILPNLEAISTQMLAIYIYKKECVAILPNLEAISTGGIFLIIFTILWLKVAILPNLEAISTLLCTTCHPPLPVLSQSFQIWKPFQLYVTATKTRNDKCRNPSKFGSHFNVEGFNQWYSHEYSRNPSKFGSHFNLESSRRSYYNKSRNPSKFGSHFNDVFTISNGMVEVDMSQSFQIWKPFQQ